MLPRYHSNLLKQMKKLLALISCATVLGLGFSACNDDDDTYNLSDYQDWRKQNDAWVAEMQQRKNPDGTPYYQTVVPAWNPNVFILMHFFNDRAETAGNLVPLYTSTVDVRYIGHNCEDEPFDSSYNVNVYGKPGISRFACNGVIDGWAIALENMHVGDTAEIIVPYNVAYGVSYTGTILPYSSLRFNLRLDDIYKYEAK